MVVNLGFILNQIKDYDFSMDEFKDRLKLQKSIYLLQSFGIYLGYDFSWYVHGPYCPSLTTNGFALESIYNEIPKEPNTKFKISTKQKLFLKFQKLMKDKTIDELEILASLHYQKILRKRDDKEAKETVEKKQERFTMNDIDKMWNELKNCELI